ncbi:MAG: hypothetical protein LBJ60_04980 [Tannerellaceae bacterium]|nr:hypothetical protein [Tannerellaceae bacterium]
MTGKKSTLNDIIKMKKIDLQDTIRENSKASIAVSCFERIFTTYSSETVRKVS